MLVFDPIPIGENAYQLSELIFNDALKVSAIDSRLNEKRISSFLGYSLGNMALPLTMTVQERYYLMLKYVQKQTNTLFSSEVNFEDCFKTETVWNEEISELGVTVRQLNGAEAEYLESKCVNAAEWIACLLAFQIKYENHEHLGLYPDRSLPMNEYIAQFSKRLNYLKSLPQSDFNLIYQDYITLNSKLFTHVELNVNNDGFVVQRGADDAPLRFRPSTCFIGIIKELDKSFT
ncbi:hypothetical protein AWW72_10830 [Acinetobacter sp. NRRL B-65365]|uniref:hypothetical protein n=1 Tax=Acinetobacter sp. NRRL B-65365 TaxID=1785092 RepID=UPI0007A029EE|nr:hypothetical protein [Acinetobacter sp. NRRL B-65365]KYQ84061.1 hypothetical protein AWW72_10830 [Acinetobacter sp. NRRL B-65365]